MDAVISSEVTLALVVVCLSLVTMLWVVGHAVNRLGPHTHQPSSGLGDHGQRTDQPVPVPVRVRVHSGRRRLG
jgi:hypothetical protein